VCQTVTCEYQVKVFIIYFINIYLFWFYKIIKWNWTEENKQFLRETHNEIGQLKGGACWRYIHTIYKNRYQKYFNITKEQITKAFHYQKMPATLCRMNTTNNKERNTVVSFKAIKVK